MKKNCFLIIALAILLTGCNSGEPTKETIKKYFSDNTQAEKIILDKLQFINQTFGEFKDSINSKKQSKIDLRPTLIIESFAKDPDYKDLLYVDEFELTNDSSGTFLYYDPIIDKIDREGPSIGIFLHETQVIIHRNGDLEIKAGNMISADNNAAINIFIDGQTGGIINFRKDDWGEDNYFHLTPKGIMDVGADYSKYNEGSATKIVEVVYNDFQRLATSLQK